jgi:cytochrome c oxidase subunit 4
VTRMTVAPAPVRTTLMVGASLLILAAASFALSHVDLGPAALGVALAIAATKASLVLAIFMSLARERASVVYALVVGLLFLGLLLTLVLTDVMLRS